MTKYLPDTAALDMMVELLSGREWDGEDIERVAEIIERTGRKIAEPRVTLESCVCGECFDCPDGWHYGDDNPCSCTADCALTEEDDDG